ncbi:MAG: 4'-phosphopantetheinyl transferase superfamily protein [Elusimicrobiales bacterium]|nr:4'-phosphopantetheinyl transferase superfamily protein [Elusimicrobiales bacterium]
MKNGVLTLVHRGEILVPEELLSPAELAEFAALRLEKRRTEWLRARAAAKRAFLEHRPDCGFSFREIIVSKAETGEPYLTANGVRLGTSVSLSHSGDYGAAAVCENCKSVGVDIEKIEPRPRSWAADSFYPTEIPAGAGPGELTALWTRKEAVLKALGIGLSTDLYDVRFEAGARQPALFNRARRAWEARGAGIFDLQLSQQPQDYITTVAILN